jgi:iron complex transport system ATP-binding protein
MITLENVHFAIEDKKILRGISVSWVPHRVHGVVGPNGSGKSTLLKNICRIWEPQAGTVRINGKDCRDIPRKTLSTLVTLVPQNTTINFPISVYEMVSFGRNPHLGRFEGLRKLDRDLIEWSLRETDTYDLKDRNINELSGGEGQLAIIARALATEASIILLDEPTSGLDIRHTLTIMELLGRLKEQGKTIVATLHDLNLARRFCDTVTIVSDGTIAYTGPPSGAFDEERIKNVFAVNVKEIASDADSFLYFYP